MSRFLIHTKCLLCSGLNNEDERQSAPLTGALCCFHAPRLDALRGGDWNEETPVTENKKDMLLRRFCARTLSRCIILLLEHRFQPTPMLNACSMFPGE